MDLLWLLCVTVSVSAWHASGERHRVYWNSSNPHFLWNDYTVEVRMNDYLDIVCPHYTRGKIPLQEAERYVLYMVELEDYEACKPQSFDQLHWNCSTPFAAHAPEKLSVKFQRYTPFSLGKEFHQGESYYYISKPLHHHGQECLRLKVDVVGAHGSKNKNMTVENVEIEGSSIAAGGVHNPSNMLPADDPIAMIPVGERSVASSGVRTTSVSIFVTLSSLLLIALLH